MTSPNVFMHKLAYTVIFKMAANLQICNEFSLQPSAIEKQKYEIKHSVGKSNRYRQYKFWVPMSFKPKFLGLQFWLILFQHALQHMTEVT